MSDAGATARSAASVIHRASVGTARITGRAFRNYRSLRYERRLAAIAAILLFFTLFLPWYQETVIANGATGKAALRHASISLSGWGSFSFVEAAVLLVAVGVLTLLYQRAEGRAFHLPGGDGWIITIAGGWTCALVVWRIFDKQGTSTAGQLATTYGIEWGIFVALAVAVFLTYAGSRIRAAHAPEPPLPGEDGYQAPAAANSRPRRGRRETSEQADDFYIPRASPSAETVAYDDAGEDPDAQETQVAGPPRPPARPATRPPAPPAARPPAPPAERPPAPPAERPPAPRPARPPRPARAAGSGSGSAGGGRPPSERRTGWLSARPMHPDEFPDPDQELGEDAQGRRTGPSPPPRPQTEQSDWSYGDTEDWEEDQQWEDDGGQEPPDSDSAGADTRRQWDVTDFEYDRRVRSPRGHLPADAEPELEEGPADDVDYYVDDPHEPPPRAASPPPHQQGPPPPRASPGPPRPASPGPPRQPRPEPARRPLPYDIDASEDETIIGPPGDASEDATVIDRRRQSGPYDVDDVDETLIDPRKRPN